MRRKARVVPWQSKLLGMIRWFGDRFYRGDSP
jgi:hypothetical protein